MKHRNFYSQTSTTVTMTYALSCIYWDRRKGRYGEGIEFIYGAEASPMPDFKAHELVQKNETYTMCLDESRTIAHLHIRDFISCES